jgi:phosphatidylinositol alpha 1,6-mannosyltransferase
MTGSPATDRATLAAGLRLAIFSDTWLPQVNGVSRTLDRLVKAVRARGGDVRVFTPSDPARAPDPMVVNYPSIAFWAYPQLRMSAPTIGTAMRDLTAWRPTLIHATDAFGLGLAGLRVARALGVPLVSSYHTSFSAYANFYHLGALSGIGWKYFRWFHNAGIRTYCPTRAIEREVQAHGFENTRIWSRGIDAARFSPGFRSAALRAELGADDDTIVVAYIGRIALEKGLDVLLDAMHRVRAQAGGRKLCFALAGDGPFEPTFRRDAPPGTTFVGMIGGDRLSQFYASSDLFVFPSVTDTFGNVLMEAMASGLAVLGADSGPTSELLADGRGFLFPAGDAAAMAREILRLADDRASRAGHAAAGLAYARTRSWDVIFDELITDYRDAERAGATP